MAKRTTVVLPDWLREKAEKRAREEFVTFSTFLRRALIAAVESNKWDVYNFLVELAVTGGTKAEQRRRKELARFLKLPETGGSRSSSRRPRSGRGSTKGTSSTRGR
jgi:hypothetical protein